MTRNCFKPLGRSALGEADVIGSQRFALTDREFERIAEIARDLAGLDLGPGKKALVSGRLARRVRLLGLDGFADYCAHVLEPDAEEERGHMIAALTTNVTAFFREAHHFSHLRDVVLPDLNRAALDGLPVRIWSAGCSSGQEPYSIALTLLASMANVGALDFRIIATDIDSNMLRLATTGIYPDDAVAEIEPDLRRRFFHPVGEGGQWKIDDIVRDLVVFRRLNFAKTWPVRGPFDIIFCRNVTIYFGEAMRQTMWAGFARLLRPGGRLYIGHAERIGAPASDYFVPDGTTVYRRTDAVCHDPAPPAERRLNLSITIR
ncbi:MAG: protein-glutamate O-methyltransferase [Pseudomonadota bacterium]